MTRIEPERGAPGPAGTTVDHVCRLLDEWMEHPKVLDRDILEYSRAAITHLGILNSSDSQIDFARLAVANAAVDRAYEYQDDLRPTGEPLNFAEPLNWLKQSVGYLLRSQKPQALESLNQGLVAISEAYKEFKTLAAA